MLEGVLRARSANSSSLVKTLKELEPNYSEKQFSEKWLSNIVKQKDILPFGWYQPPPKGMSVLIGSPPAYSRLKYESLRYETNFPRGSEIIAEDALLYPYFSAIDSKTYMIGDHVGTYYRGNNPLIRDWIKAVFNTTRELVDSICLGMQFSELYLMAEEKITALGAVNNTYSLSGGLSSDIGHTIPYFENNELSKFVLSDTNTNDLINKLSSGRKFINKSNEFTIDNNCAFTIEPQIMTPSLPMVSFHFIVCFTKDGKFIIGKFKEIFDILGMSPWIYAKYPNDDLA